MNINFTYFFDYIEPVFEESILPSLTSQQAQIALIALTTFGACAITSYYFRPKQFTVQGQLYDGRLEGLGKIQFLQSMFFKGQAYPSGTILEGHFKHSQLHGFGKIIYPGGRILEGQFEKGNLHGPGKDIYPDRNIQEGIFDKGNLVNFRKIPL